MTPLELTQKLMNAAIAAGAEYRVGVVNGVTLLDSKVAGVSIAGEGIIPADKVVLCAGPWCVVYSSTRSETMPQALTKEYIMSMQYIGQE